MKQTDILLVTPPFTQPNTPYPAIMQLRGYLNSQGYSVHQFDLGIELFTKIFSQETLQELFESIVKEQIRVPKNLQVIVDNQSYYLTHIDSVIRFLQGIDNTIAHGLSIQLKPLLSKPIEDEELEMLFGSAGVHDWAKYNCTKFIEELGLFIQTCFDDYFSFTKYAEHLSLVALDFEPLLKALDRETFITKIIQNEIDTVVKLYNPKSVGFTIPFPGNLYGALVASKKLKECYPNIKVLFGGGFVNTELRWITEKRIFKYVDYILLDDGELPLNQYLKYQNESIEKRHLVRTFYQEDGEIVYSGNEANLQDITHSEIAIPSFDGIKLDKYLSFLSTTNPMQRLWSDGRWNKLALTHGCYWAKCSFCDTSLDYIKRYSKPSIDKLVERVLAVKDATKCSGFHFVDEAAPPALLKEFCQEIITRKISITWWVNIRFEKSFNTELIQLMSQAGCIAVSGGLEVASDRLLKLINKGVTIEQVANVTNAFSQNNIMVHAYLMYGFPTQTEQETIDALEIVRQLFDNNLIQSAFWHRFALTEHSDIGINPSKYKIEKIDNDPNQFARNDMAFIDPTGCDHEKFSEGLRISLYNFMQGVGLEMNVCDWFNFKTPKSTHKRNYIRQLLK